ncbi:MAG: CapA family protein [Micrococcales bacterium]|nr:CapA family protein [Micrococcales bacterium]
MGQRAVLGRARGLVRSVLGTHRRGHRRRALARDRRIMGGFAGLAAVSFVLVGWQVASALVPPDPEYVEISVVPHKPGEVSIAIAGDTLFGDGAAAFIEAEGVEATMAGVAGMLQDADVAVVNIEAPITTLTEPLNPGAQFSYASSPESAAALAAIGVDVLQLGNNHTMDRGVAGLVDTMTIAEEAGLVTVGAGTDRAQAARPVLVRTDTLTIALVSFGEDYGAAKRSGDGLPGMVPFSVDAVIAAERNARRAGADRVVALVHWGDNYSDVNDLQRYWAGELVAAGYDAVVGSGPHVLNPVEIVDGVPVVYSLGNFVFGSPGRFAGFGRAGLGAVATVSFDANGGTLALRCIRTDNMVVGYVPRECGADESAVAATDLQGGLVWTGPTGTLPF